MLSQTIRLLALSAPVFALTIQQRDDHHEPASNVTVVTLDKTVNATGGVANVAIAGTLVPFGGIGAGCGVNWHEGVSYGGGLQAGSEAFGLGGGFTITPGTLEVGLGLGINPSNASADVNFKGHTNGTFELRFSTASGFTCDPSVEDGHNVLVCRTA